MATTLQLGDTHITVIQKDVKNVHLSVHPPDGRVTLVAPLATRLDVARAYAISKLTWIREQQQQFKTQARESDRHYVDRESHYLWGKRYLLYVVYHNAKPCITLDCQRLTLNVRPGSDREKRAKIFYEWQKSLLHTAIPPLIQKWESKLGVTVSHYFLQRMKTKWGSCNAQAQHIRLNTELVKKPKDLLEYVIVHEMAHLIEPNHGERFVALLDRHYSHWREARDELNALPLSAESWDV